MIDEMLTGEIEQQEEAAGRDPSEEILYFAESTGGFYSSLIHFDNIPADAVELTREEYTAKLAELNS